MDFSWSELLVVGIVALIIIGPKDLPGMFRELGRFTAKLRSMGREFSRAMEQAGKDSGVKDVADDLNRVVDPLKKAANPSSMGLDAVKSAADRFEKWDPLKNAAKPTQPLTVGKPLTPPPMPPVVPAAAAPAPVAAVAEAAAPAAPAAPVGPNTAALYEQQAARRAAVAASVEKIKAEAAAAPVAAPAPATGTATGTATPPARVRGGRLRKRPEAATGEGDAE